MHALDVRYSNHAEMDHPNTPGLLESPFMDIKHTTDVPPRCESRMSMKRPPLRRSESCRALHGFGDDSSDDESDDESNRSFCVSTHRRANYSPDNSDDSDSDEDEELAQIIGLTPMGSEVNVSLPPPSLPIPQVTYEVSEYGLEAPLAYHGFSDNALALVKRVWALRRNAWSSHTDAYETSTEATAEAYDGIASPSDYRPPIRGLFPLYPLQLTPVSSGNKITTPPPAGIHSGAAQSNLNVPIYPRIGDIPTIRDDRTVIIDRAFCNFPMYTIRKILYLHDMLDSVRSGAPEKPTFPATLTPSSTSSDDEHTLVDAEVVYTADDHNAEMDPLCKMVQEAGAFREGRRNCFQNWQILMEKTRHQRAAAVQSVEEGAVQETVTRVVVHEGHQKAPEKPLMMGTPARLQSSRPRPSKFFFADDNEDYDYDEDEEDDYDYNYGKRIYSSARPFPSVYEPSYYGGRVSLVCAGV